MRIFSSAEYCLRVARRMSLMVLSAAVCRACDFCLICVPFGHYDEPEILPYANLLSCSIGADVKQIKRLLEEDDERKQKQQNTGYKYSWDQPIFNDKFEKRRLRVLNAIFVALERYGVKPSIRGREARELSIRVNDENVSFTLDASSQKPDRFNGAAISSRGTPTKLKLSILSWRSSSDFSKSWEDADSQPLEKQLDEIIVELIMSAEQFYRQKQQRHYEWLVERKADLIEEARKRKEEEERLERERLIRLENARVDRLLSDASSLRQAEEIRAYVESVRNMNKRQKPSIGTEDLEVWAEWAIKQADRIDHVASGRFLNSMNDSEETTEIEDGHF